MRLTSAGNLPISVFLALGAATAGYSCWKAKPEERKDVLVRSSTIVASSIVGVVASQKYSDKIIKQKLTKREYFVIKYRYGLNHSPAYTQREVADMLKISRSYISRIEKKALHILKDCLAEDIFLD